MRAKVCCVGLGKCGNISVTHNAYLANGQSATVSGDSDVEIIKKYLAIRGSFEQTLFYLKLFVMDL